MRATVTLIEGKTYTYPYKGGTMVFTPNATEVTDPELIHQLQSIGVLKVAVEQDQPSTVDTEPDGDEPAKPAPRPAVAAKPTPPKAPPKPAPAPKPAPPKPTEE